MNQRKVTVVLVVITIISCFITILSIPKKKGVTETKEQITLVKQQIKAQKEKTVKNSPLEHNFNLVKAQKEAEKQLKTVFETVYGGLHSTNDLNENKAVIEKTLGNDLATEVLGNAYRGDEFFINKNVSTTVAFGNVSDKTQAPIYVAVSYEMKGYSETFGNQVKTYSRVYELQYNLVKQQVVSYKDESLLTK